MWINLTNHGLVWINLTGHGRALTGLSIRFYAFCFTFHCGFVFHEISRFMSSWLLQWLDVADLEGWWDQSSWILTASLQLLGAESNGRLVPDSRLYVLHFVHFVFFSKNHFVYFIQLGVFSVTGKGVLAWMRVWIFFPWIAPLPVWKPFTSYLMSEEKPPPQGRKAMGSTVLL